MVFHPQFPWHAVEHYTVATRNQIFTATRDQVKTLVANLKRGGGPNLSQSLLTELMLAGLNASGFSENQRWELVQAAEYVGGEVKLSPLMKWWPWETLGRKAGSEEDVIEVCSLAVLSCLFFRGLVSSSTLKTRQPCLDLSCLILSSTVNTKFHSHLLFIPSDIC